MRFDADGMVGEEGEGGGGRGMEEGTVGDGRAACGGHASNEHGDWGAEEREMLAESSSFGGDGNNHEHHSYVAADSSGTTATTIAGDSSNGGGAAADATARIPSPSHTLLSPSDAAGEAPQPTAAPSEASWHEGRSNCNYGLLEAFEVRGRIVSSETRLQISLCAFGTPFGSSIFGRSGAHERAS